MSLEEKLEEIEDFEEAYYSRIQDMKDMSNVDRKIMKMHWGGVVIVCLVNYIIVEKYDIHKRNKHKKCQWFSSNAENILKAKEQSGENITNSDYSNNAIKLEDGHNFNTMIKEILQLDTDGINEDLENVYEPLGKKFIDLRYEIEDLELIEENYRKWEESYNKVVEWLNRELDNLNGELE